MKEMRSFKFVWNQRRKIQIKWIQTSVEVLLVLLTFLSLLEMRHMNQYLIKNEEKNRMMTHMSNFLPVFEFHSEKIYISNNKERTYVSTCVIVTNKSEQAALNVRYDNFELRPYKGVNELPNTILNNPIDNNTLLTSNNFIAQRNPAEAISILTECPQSYKYIEDIATDQAPSLFINQSMAFMFTIETSDIHRNNHFNFVNFLYFKDKIGTKYAIKIVFRPHDNEVSKITVNQGGTCYYSPAEAKNDEWTQITNVSK